METTEGVGARSAGRRVEGVRAPLFDRLVDEHPGEASEPHPFRVLSLAGLKASVGRELERLLNTRCPLTVEEVERRELRTVLEYGLPDFGAMFTRDRAGWQILEKSVRRTIEAFEPRLEDPVVTVLGPGDDERTLRIVIRGSLRVGREIEAVSFPMAIEPSRTR